jgi:glutamate synthase domain-containing protein 1/glutamate synthase domain-containing protein 3
MDAEAILASRRLLPRPPAGPLRKLEAEGGCGVIGMASSLPIEGRHLLAPLQQMRNRGNGKGGGIAAAGLDPSFLGVRPEILAQDHLLAIAYLDPAARAEVEQSFLEPTFAVDGARELVRRPGARSALGLDVEPPEVRCYLVRPRPDVLCEFAGRHGFSDEGAAADELVYQTSYRLDHAFYAAAGEKRAFVLSRGKDLLVVKMVGYGDDVVRTYGLEGLRAHVWIGHHRYPTKGRVWHPGGAHPFVGLHEALVHNGDFANYASLCSWLAQRRVYPLFLTDTEVAALVFDLLHRVQGYPLEYVIEALAPTTERDFTLLPPAKQRIYRMLRAVHAHGSPDGPWFFLVAQSDPRSRACRLVGITDTSMLRPQVFALQQGEATIGLAGSEKQAIDAVLESLAAADDRFWPRADLYWNARGGSHTDGGAFAFTVHRDGRAGPEPSLVCTDKFGRRVEADPAKRPPSSRVAAAHGHEDARLLDGGDVAEELFARLAERLPEFTYGRLSDFLGALERTAVDDASRERALALITLLMDRRTPTGRLKRSAVLALLDRGLAALVDAIRRRPTPGHAWVGCDDPLPEPTGATVVLDARGFASEGPRSLSRAIVALHGRGFRRLLVANVRGQRFIGCGLGPRSHGMRVEVYGAPGDYLGSGLDGAEIVVHGTAQDQLAQIMKDGKLVVHGDVGQTLLYAAKGGETFVLGSAAGRPLINAVGRARAVINGTCLDYLAESFMAGDPLQGGGFAIVNGLAQDEDGELHDLDDPYPGGNLFSLAAGGAIYLRDPRGLVAEDQLNGGEIVAFEGVDWELIRPYLEENERLFGIPVGRLLSLDGRLLAPGQAYRKIQPSRHEALLPEEAWVKRMA